MNSFSTSELEGFIAKEAGEEIAAQPIGVLVSEEKIPVGIVYEEMQKSLYTRLADKLEEYITLNLLEATELQKSSADFLQKFQKFSEKIQTEEKKIKFNEEIQNIVEDLIITFTELWNKKIFHGDIALHYQNIWTDKEGEIRLIDFGFSFDYEKSQKTDADKAELFTTLFSDFAGLYSLVENIPEYSTNKAEDRKIKEEIIDDLRENIAGILLKEGITASKLKQLIDEYNIEEKLEIAYIGGEADVIRGPNFFTIQKPFILRELEEKEESLEQEEIEIKVEKEIPEIKIQKVSEQAKPAAEEWKKTSREISQNLKEKTKELSKQTKQKSTTSKKCRDEKECSVCGELYKETKENIERLEQGNTNIVIESVEKSLEKLEQQVKETEEDKVAWEEKVKELRDRFEGVKKEKNNLEEIVNELNEKIEQQKEKYKGNPKYIKGLDRIKKLIEKDKKNYYEESDDKWVQNQILTRLQKWEEGINRREQSFFELAFHEGAKDLPDWGLYEYKPLEGKKSKLVELEVTHYTPSKYYKDIKKTFELGAEKLIFTDQTGWTFFVSEPLPENLKLIEARLILGLGLQQYADKEEFRDPQMQITFKIKIPKERILVKEQEYPLTSGEPLLLKKYAIAGGIFFDDLVKDFSVLGKRYPHRHVQGLIKQEKFKIPQE